MSGVARERDEPSLESRSPLHFSVTYPQEGLGIGTVGTALERGALCT